MLAWIWIELVGMMRNDEIWNIYDPLCVAYM